MHTNSDILQRMKQPREASFWTSGFSFWPASNGRLCFKAGILKQWGRNSAPMQRTSIKDSRDIIQEMFNYNTAWSQCDNNLKTSVGHLSGAKVSEKVIKQVPKRHIFICAVKRVRSVSQIIYYFFIQTESQLIRGEWREKFCIYMEKRANSRQKFLQQGCTI